MNAREAQQNDSSALSILATEVFTETYGHKIPDTILQRYVQQTFSSEAFALELSEGKIFVVGNDKEMVGFIKLSKYSQDTLELVRLYVDSAHHGQGVAKMLLEKALEYAKAQGYISMRLVVWEENTKAVRFYQKHEFEFCGEQKVYVEAIEFNDYIMRKEIL